jgi:hypothetical protein
MKEELGLEPAIGDDGHEPDRSRRGDRRDRANDLYYFSDCRCSNI